MITEDYVSFEVAKLLKEKGFMEGAIIKFFASGYDSKGNILDIRDTELKDYPRPTIQMAIKWLREIYNIEVAITHGFCNGDKELTYFWSIVKIADGYLEYPMQNQNSMEYTEVKAKAYEEAVEAAIKYCLTNLIK